MTFAVKNKENPIDLVKREKRHKRQISRQRRQIKRRQMTVCRPELQLREREREWERERERETHTHWGETRNYPHSLSSSPLWRKRLTRKSPSTPLLTALVTSNWLRARKSNKPTTNKHRTSLLLFWFYINVFLQTQLFELFTYLFPMQLLKFLRAFEFICFSNCVYFSSLQLYADITQVWTSDWYPWKRYWTLLILP